MPTTRRSAGWPQEGGDEPPGVHTPTPAIDPALGSIAVATPDVPIAPELLMQDAEAQTAEATQGSKVNQDQESEWEYDWDDCEVGLNPFHSQGIRSSQVMK